MYIMEEILIGTKKVLNLRGREVHVVEIDTNFYEAPPTTYVYDVFRDGVREHPMARSIRMPYVPRIVLKELRGGVMPSTLGISCLNPSKLVAWKTTEF